MTLDITKFNATVEVAKAKAADSPAWLRAIEKAADAIINGKWIITPLANCYAVTTESGKTYFANGHCQCEAFRRSQPCKHRCGARLLDLYDEKTATPATPSRAEVIADIKRIWPTACPGLPLASELMARFGKNKLEMLDDEMLRRVRLAVAM